ncbi:MAG: ParA family protein [Pirellulaceae bacterium]
MRSIAVINQKGGVGKTTTAVNLSAAIAATGQRVCLIDLDPQAHASLHLGIALSDDDLSMYDVLTGQSTLADAQQTIDEHLTLVPAHLNLAAAEMELVSEVGRDVILRDKWRSQADAYDYLIIDCPPSLGLLTLNALTTVHEVFLPLQPHFLALHGLSKLLQTLELVATRLNPQLRLTGVVMCMFDAGTRLAVEVTRDVEQFFESHGNGQEVWAGARCFQSRIRRNVRLAEAPSFGQSIFQYAPKSHGATDYQDLAHEVLGLDASRQLEDVAEAAA